MKLIITIFFTTSLWLYGSLPSDIQYFLNKSKLPSKDVSIYIKELGTNKIIASHNAEVSTKPASVIKVMTNYAALLKFGFNYRWPTQFYTKGKISAGVLRGDLIVKGYGDPTLSNKHLDSIVRNIKQKGIKKITGNIIIDRSYFNVGSENSSHFDQNPYSPYNAMPDAMMFNERTSTVCITAKKSSAYKELKDQSYNIVNHIQYVDKACKGKYSWIGSRVDNSGASPKIILNGKISKRCGTRKVCKVITKPYKAFYYALKDKLQSNSISVKGNLRLSKVPRNSRLLFTHYSRPLEEIVSKTLKKSNNLYARHLMLHLGAKVYGAPATLNKGREAVKYILKKYGALGRGTLYIENGCGLSRSARANAKMFATMFESAYKQYGQRWMNALSIAGVDGTIKKRFRYSPAKNRAWMKTGTLKRVKNIGGYVKNRSGKLYIVVVIVNTKAGRWKASQLQNDIIIWLSKSKNIAQVSELQEPNKVLIEKQSITIDTPQKIVHATPSTKYYIQTGSFSHKPNSDYYKKINALGLKYTTKYNKVYKILIGPYGDETKARDVLEKVRNNINERAFLLKNI